jgi:hypothetical protein
MLAIHSAKWTQEKKAGKCAVLELKIGTCFCSYFFYNQIYQGPAFLQSHNIHGAGGLCIPRGFLSLVNLSRSLRTDVDFFMMLSDTDTCVEFQYLTWI